MRRWVPILDPTRRALADRILRHIVDQALNERRRDDRLGWPDAERALFFAYVAAARGGSAAHAEARRRAARIVEAIERLPLPGTLHGGVIGLGWVLRHLGRLGHAAVDLDALDGALAERLEAPSGPLPFDLISGLVGLAVFAAGAADPRVRARSVHRLVERLFERSTAVGAGRAWLAEPTSLDGPPARERAHYNLGLAHGVAGVVVCLARLRSVAPADSRARLDELVSEALRFLLAAELPPGAPSRFPKWISPAGQPEPARLAWCHGDPGVALALVRAGEALARPAWIARGLGLARELAEQGPERAGVEDPILCHGSAGLLQLFNRLYQVYREEPFRRAARRWFDVTAARFRPGDGAGGFRRLIRVDGARRAVGDWGLVTGTLGVGLSLLAAASACAPDWDELLLLAPAPAGGGDQDAAG